MLGFLVCLLTCCTWVSHCYISLCLRQLTILLSGILDYVEVFIVRIISLVKHAAGEVRLLFFSFFCSVQIATNWLSSTQSILEFTD